MSCFSISPWHQVETNVELWTSKADEERWYPTAWCSHLPMAINGAHLPIGKWWIKWWWMVGTWCSCEDIIDVLPVVGSSSARSCIAWSSSWVSAAQEDDEIDEDIVDIGEENLDRMASHCAEKDRRQRWREGRMLRWRAEAFEVLTVTFLGICIQRYRYRQV